MHTWLRFTGRLWEDLSFDPGVGWETDVIARRPPEGDGSWVLELLDRDGRVVNDVHPAVRFDRVAGAHGGRMSAARLVAYLPMHARGRRVRLRRRDFVVHEQLLVETPPRVAVTRCEVDDDRHVLLAWSAEGPTADLSYRVVYVAEGRGVFPLVSDLRATELRVPLARLPGSPQGRLAVLASDGLRSGFDVSAPFAVPQRPARVAILDPEPRLAVPWGQPVTLRGAAHDDAGRRLDEAGFVWTLDGELLAREQHLVLARDLGRGDHTLVLAWEGAGSPRAETRVQFTVASPARSAVEPLEPESPPVGMDEPWQTTARIKL